MARTAQFDDDQTTTGEVRQDVSNGIPEKKLTKHVKDVEALEAKIDDIMKKAGIAAQPHIDRIKEIKKQAAEDGIPKKVFGATLRVRKLLKKAGMVQEKLNDDQQDLFIECNTKLGDLADQLGPLGAYASRYFNDAARIGGEAEGSA